MNPQLFGHYEMFASENGNAAVSRVMQSTPEQGEERLVVLPGGMYAKAAHILVESLPNKEGRRTDGMIAMTLHDVLKRYEALDFHYFRMKEENARLKRVIWDVYAKGPSNVDNETKEIMRESLGLSKEPQLPPIVEGPSPPAPRSPTNMKRPNRKSPGRRSGVA